MPLSMSSILCQPAGNNPSLIPTSTSSVSCRLSSSALCSVPKMRHLRLELTSTLHELLDTAVEDVLLLMNSQEMCQKEQYIKIRKSRES